MDTSSEDENAQIMSILRAGDRADEQKQIVLDSVPEHNAAGHGGKTDNGDENDYRKLIKEKAEMQQKLEVYRRAHQHKVGELVAKRVDATRRAKVMKLLKKMQLTELKIQEMATKMSAIHEPTGNDDGESTVSAAQKC